MMRLRSLWIPFMAVLLAACSPSPGSKAAPDAKAPVPDMTALSAALHARIERAPGTIAVDLIDLGSGAHLAINQDVMMHAASTMKVPVMLELFRQADAGRFSLDDKIRVKNTFTSLADGSTYSLPPSSDSETKLYARVGDKLTIRNLLQRMITRSSNLATNNLIELVGPKNVEKTMRAIGADGMHVRRGVEDLKAYRAGINNRTTAAALARIMDVIARCANPESGFKFTGRLAPLDTKSCKGMLDILLAQKLNSLIPAGLPEGVPVAHKTGSITKIHHDAAIVYPNDRAPYVLVVMTHGIADPDQSAAIAADISHLVWQALVGKP
ncbi:MAG TPA: serine hydrolase [Oleiagrimonas sp.]|nr:serine hydrolase [Oleiagrimonas sp.]